MDFELESLEPRLLLTGVSWAGAATGGDWNVASNWSGNLIPQAGDSVTIAGLNSGAQVTMGSGSVQIQDITISSGTLAITGGSLSVNGNGSVSAGASVQVSAGTFAVTGNGEFTNQGSVTINGTGSAVVDGYFLNQTTGSVGLSISGSGSYTQEGYAQLISTDSGISVAGNGQLVINSNAQINDTSAPVQTALQVTDNGVVSVESNAYLTVASSVSITGAGQLLQNGGTITLQPSTGPPGTGSINALASTNPLAIDLQSGTLSGSGTITSTNASIGDTIRANGSGTSEIILGIADQLNFLTGASFIGSTKGILVLSDPASGTGTYQVNFNGLSVAYQGGDGVSITSGTSYPIVEINTPATVTGTVTNLNVVTPFVGTSSYDLSHQPAGLAPVVNLTAGHGVSYLAQTVGIDNTFKYVGAAGGDWNTASNWVVETNTDASPAFIAATTAPTLDSDVIIPGGLGAGPVFNGYMQLSSLRDGSGLTISGGSLTIQDHTDITTTTSLTIPGLVSYVTGTLSMSAGTLNLWATNGISFANGLSVTGGTVNIESGLTSFSGSSTFEANGLVFYGGVLELLSGSVLTIPTAFTVGYGDNLYAVGTINTPDLILYSWLRIGLSNADQSDFTNGSLTVNGNFDAMSSAITAFYVSGPSSSQVSHLTVNGTANFNGTLYTAYSAAYAASPADGVYVIMTATGGVNVDPATGLNLANYMTYDTSVAGQIGLDIATNSSANVVLGDGLAGTAGFIQSLATYFDLAKINYASEGLSPLNLPVAPEALATLFNLGSALSTFTLPTIGQAGTTAEIDAALTSAGYTVSPVDPTNPNNIAAAFTATIATGLTGTTSQLNALSPGLLAGLGTSPLTAAMTWTGSLAINLVFGIDGSGFYISSASTLSLTVTGTGTVNSAATVGGLSTTIAGTAAANLVIILQLPANPGTARLSDLGGDLSGLATATATGTSNVTVSFTAGPLALNYVSADTLSEFFAGSTTIVLAPTLTGTITMPGLTTSGTTTLSPVAITGTLSGGTWTLTGTYSGLALAGFASSGTITVALTPTSFVGTGTLNLSPSFLDQAGAGTVIALTAAFNATSGTLVATQTISTPTVVTGTGTLLTPSTSVVLHANLAFTFGAQAVSGTMSFTGAGGLLSPDSKYTETLSDSNSDGIAFSLSYNVVTEVYAVTVDTITVAVPYLFSFAATNVVLDYDRTNANTAQVMATVANASVTLLAFNNVVTTGPPSPSFTTSVSFQANGFVLGSTTATLTGIRIGTLIQIGSAAVTVTTTTFVQGTAATGSVSFAPTSAGLYPTVSAVIGLATSLSGSLNLNGTTWLLTASSITVTVGEAITFTQSAVSFSYNLAGPSNQVVSTLSGVTINSPQIGLLNAATLGTLNIRADGISFGSFSLTAPVGTNGTIGSYLALVLPNITATNFGFTSGTATPYSGTVAFTLGGLVVYPAAPVFSVTPTGLTAGYDFSGATPTGTLTIFLSHFLFKLGSALQVDADNVTITPDQNTLVTIPTATLSSSLLSNMTGTLTNFAITRTGFTVGTATLATPVGQSSTLRIPGVNLRVATLTTVSLAINGLAYSTSAGLSGTIALSAAQVQIFPDSAVFNITGTGVTGGYLVNSAGISQLTFTIQHLVVNFGTDFQLVGQNIVITPEASTVMSVGSLTGSLNFGAGAIGITGGNFGIASDGTILTLPGFAITINNSTSSGLLDFPSWLPISLTSVGLSWANFNADPDSFDIILSASVTGLDGLPVTVSGAVTGLVLDPSKIEAGLDPIINVGSAAITLSGNLLGMQVSGSLALGLLRIDANHNILPDTDTTTPVYRSTLYGALRVSATIGGVSGFAVSIGVSDNGPLSVYVSATTHIILDPESGLELTGLSGSVTFNSTLPTITDPHDLRNVYFSGVATQTDAQWLAALQTQVWLQTVNPSNTSFWSALSAPMVINASATMTSEYLTGAQLNATVNLFVDTTGRFEANGVFNLPSGNSMTLSLYANLSQVSAGTGTFLFLSDTPSSGSPTFTVFGSLVFDFTRSDGQAVDANHPADTYTFTITGGVTFSIKGISPTITGTVILSFLPNNIFDLDVQGSVNLPLLGNALTVGGSFVLDVSDPSNPEFYGALNVQTNLNVLKSLGVDAQGTAFLRINTTSSAVNVSVLMPGNPTPVIVAVAADDYSVGISGTFSFSYGGVQWFQIQGSGGYSIGLSSLAFSVAGTLTVGPSGAPFLTFVATGGGTITSAGFSAYLLITLAPDIPESTGLVLNGNFLFTANSTGQAQYYLQPNGSYLGIDSGPVNGGPAGPYAEVSGGLTLSLDGIFTLTGMFNIVVGNNSLTATLTSGHTSLTVNNDNLFTFDVSGSLLITQAGVAGTLAMTLDEGLSNTGSFGFNMNATFLLEFNTTSAVVISGGHTIAAGSALVVATGSINFTSEVGVTLAGTFTFSGSASQVSVALTNGTATFAIGSTTIVTLNVAGGFSFIAPGGGNGGVVLALTASLTSSTNSLGFSLTGTFTLEFNSTNSTQTVAGITVNAQTFEIAVSNATLTLDGVVLTGNFGITATPTVLTVAASANMAFYSSTTKILQFSVSGFLQLGTAGITASLSVGLSLATSPGFGLTGSFTADFNTTGATVTVGGASVAAHSISLSGTGTLTLAGVAFTSSFMIGATGTTVAAATFTFTFASTFAVTTGSITYFTFGVTGGLQITSSGVAGYLTATIQGQPPGGEDLSVSGTAVLEVNTTSTSAQVGPHLIAPGLEFIVTGTVTMGGFNIASATLGLIITPTSVTVSLAGGISLAIGPKVIFSLTVAGSFSLTSSGYYGVIALGGNVPSFLGIGAGLNFYLEFNTTSSAHDVTILGSTQDFPLIAGPFVGVDATGTISAGGFTISATVGFVVESSYILMLVNGTVGVFGFTSTLSAFAEITTTGFAISAYLSLPSISTAGFTLSGSFLLELNTSSATVGNIGAGTFEVAVSGATLSLGGLSLSGSFAIGYSSGAFFVRVPSSNPITLSFYSFGSVAVSGYVYSSGSFSFTGTLHINVGNSSYADVQGNISVTFSNSGLSGSFSGQLYVFGADVASAYGSISSSGFSVSANISVSVPGINLTVSGNASFSVTSSDVSGSFTLSGRLFGGINASAKLAFDTATNYYLVSGTFSVSIGGSDLGASASGTVTVSSDSSKDGISISGSAWAGFYVWNPFGSDWWVGASISFSASGDFTGNFSVSLSVDGVGFTVNINLSSIIQAFGSDISGGYAYIDTNGNGVWDPATEARVPVDSNGNFSFNVGDPTLWKANNAGGYAFDDLNGNGVWDPATEARTPLVNGQLPTALLPVSGGGTASSNPLTALGLLQNYGLVTTNGTAILDTTRGQVTAIGGQVLNTTTGTTTANTSPVLLGGVIAGYTGLVGPGQTVFFDTNGNGILDAGEISVQADSRGFYTFNSGQQQLSSLGILASFDTNHNGVIDTGEGTIVLTGGTDKNSGQPITTITRVSAANVGTGVAVSAQPLAAIENLLVLRGYTLQAIDTRLSLVFGLPTGIIFGAIDPQTNAGLTPTESTQVLTITSQLETFLMTATSVLTGAGATAAAAQAAALNALGDRIMQNYSAATQSTIAPADMLDFTNLATITAMMNSAAAKAGVSPAVATVSAVATVTSQLNLAAAGYAATSTNLTRDLARIDAVTQGLILADIGNLSSASLTSSAFLSEYTGAALTALLAAASLTPLTPPTISGAGNVSTTLGSGPEQISLDVTTTTGISANVAMTATSSNTGFLANSALSIVGTGEDRVLVIQTPTGLGSTTITLTASINGVMTTETFTYTVGAPLPPAPVIFSTAPTVAVAGTVYSYGFLAAAGANGDAVAITSSTLPSWLTLTDNGNGTAILQGSPSLSDLSGSSVLLFHITITVTETNGGVSMQTFTLALVPTNQNLPTFQTPSPSLALTAGTPVTYTTSATPGTGGTTVTFTVADLPSWLTFTDNGDGSVTVTGTPAAADAGSGSFTLIATDDQGLANIQNVTFTVATVTVGTPVTGGAPVFETNPITAPITAGQPLSLPVLVSPGSGATTVAITGVTLPSWLTLTDNGNGNAVLSGTPTASGSYYVSLSAVNNLGAITTQDFTLVVQPALSLSPISPVTLTENTAKTVTLTLGGLSDSTTALVVVSSSNTLLLPQTNVTVGGTGSNRTITINPASNQFGTATVTVTVAAGGVSLSETFTLTVAPVDMPVAATGALPSFTVLPGATPITIDLSKYFVAGNTPVTYTASGSAAALAGISISGSILTIAPGSAASGLDAITITATNTGQASGRTFSATAVIHLTVQPEISISQGVIIQTAKGKALSFTVTLLTPSNQTVLVGYQTQDGTAVAGLDYVATGGTLTFAPGTTVVTINVPLISSLLLNPLDLSLGLSGAQNGLLMISDAQGSIPSDKGELSGLTQPVEITISFGFLEFVSGSPTDSTYSVSGLSSDTQAPLIVFTTSLEPAPSGSFSSLGNESAGLELAMSLSALSSVSTLHGF